MIAKALSTSTIPSMTALNVPSWSETVWPEYPASVRAVLTASTSCAVADDRVRLALAYRSS